MVVKIVQNLKPLLGTSVLVSNWNPSVVVVGANAASSSLYNKIS